MKTVLLPALFSASLIAGTALAQSDDTSRYELELTVVESGKTVIHAITYLSEENAVSLSLNADAEQFEFEASLSTEQGDASDYNVATHISLVRNGEEIAPSSLRMKAQGTTQYVSGIEGVDMISITIKPASPVPY